MIFFAYHIWPIIYILLILLIIRSILGGNRYFNNKMQYQYRSSIHCKNHPEISAGYFLAQQPWQKLCSNCALNIALCGKKIQKQLNSTQFQRKIVLNSLTNEFKQILQVQGQMNSKLTNFLQIIEQQYSKKLSQQMKNLQQYINILQKAKNQLFELYDKEVSKRINDYFERQSKIILQSMQIKKQVEYIQSNFGNLISSNNSDNFTYKIKQWNNMLDEAKKQMQIDQEFGSLQSNLKQVSTIFKESFFLISNTTLNVHPRQKLDQTFSQQIVKNSPKTSRQGLKHIHSQAIQKEKKQFNDTCLTGRTQLRLKSKPKPADIDITKRKSMTTPNTPNRKENINSRRTSRHVILSLIQNAT